MQLFPQLLVPILLRGGPLVSVPDRTAVLLEEVRRHCWVDLETRLRRGRNEGCGERTGGASVFPLWTRYNEVARFRIVLSQLWIKLRMKHERRRWWHLSIGNLLWNNVNLGASMMREGVLAPGHYAFYG